MPEQFYDIIVVLFFTAVPLILMLIQTVLSLRKKLTASFIIPFLWSALGIWMTYSGYKQGRGISGELIIFFLCGNLILAGITLLVRYIKRKHSTK